MPRDSCATASRPSQSRATALAEQTRGRAESFGATRVGRAETEVRAVPTDGHGLEQDKLRMAEAIVALIVPVDYTWVRTSLSKRWN